MLLTMNLCFIANIDAFLVVWTLEKTRFHLLVFSFGFVGVFLRFCWCSPLIVLKLSFDFTEMSSPQR